MKRIILTLFILLAVWVSWAKWINPNVPYPWETFNSEQEPEKTMAWKSADNYWETFRMNFPYHIQTIGISEQASDGSRVIIISEPPSIVEKEGVEEVFSHLNAKIEERVNKVGYDGWVKDIIVVLSEASERQVEFTMHNLYKYINGSEYKPYFLNLSLEPSSLKDKLVDVNYSVSAAEINNWFLFEGQNQIFTGQGIKSRLLTLVKEGKQGIFYSKIPGFVVWIMPKGSISEYRSEIYQFTIDSDLIIGAVAGNTCLAIIAREREADIFTLPPLRVETILQLAAADKEHLAQSYERRNMFAGKLPGGKDWAPIYLSNDLINTEYGSLLNITDQLLKSWSQHGEITYTNFIYRKPKPDDYPYHQAISKEVNANSITFNWNTKGAAYVVDYGDVQIAALNRTGSLPVTYIPEGVAESEIPFKKIRECEEKYYNFYSSFNDPNLIRVVQYATIYQLFSAFEIYADGYKNETSSPITDVNKVYAKALLDTIRNSTITDSDLPMLQLELYFSSDIKSYAKLRSYELKKDISNFYDRFGEQGLSILAYFIAHPRIDGESKIEYDPEKISEEDITELYLWCNKNNTILLEINDFISGLGFSRSAIKEEYVSSFKNSSSKWIKTPSIVESWSIDSAMQVGGHNIDAKMLGLSVDKSLVPGEIKIIEENGIKRALIAEGDLNKVTKGFIRDVEINAKVGIHHVDGKLLGGKVRKRNSVFPRIHPAKRGFDNEKLIKVVDDVEIGFNGMSLKQTTINGKEFVSLPNSPYILYPKSKASSITAINDAMKNRKIAGGEFKVISFVEDDATTATLKNYCNNSYMESNVRSIEDLGNLFAKNQRKAFHIVGHIEDGAIYMPESGVRLPIVGIQEQAKLHNVNYTIVGCESAFEKSAGQAGFVSKINSVEVAEALGMAIEGSKDIFTFTHRLAKNNNLKLIIHDVPITDLGFGIDRQRRRVAIVGGAVVGIGASSVIVISIADDPIDGDKAVSLVSKKRIL